MELRDYLHKKRMTMIDFAKKIGYHPVHLRAVKNGQMKASHKLKKLVYQVTDGAIEECDWPILEKKDKKSVEQDENIA